MSEQTKRVGVRARVISQAITNGRAMFTVEFLDPAALKLNICPEDPLAMTRFVVGAPVNVIFEIAETPVMQTEIPTSPEPWAASLLKRRRWGPAGA